MNTNTKFLLIALLLLSSASFPATSAEDDGINISTVEAILNATLYPCTNLYTGRSKKSQQAVDENDADALAQHFNKKDLRAHPENFAVIVEGNCLSLIKIIGDNEDISLADFVGQYYMNEESELSLNEVIEKLVKEHQQDAQTMLSYLSVQTIPIFEVRFEGEETMLHLLARETLKGSEQSLSAFINYLRSRGQDIQNKDGNTPLHTAVNSQVTSEGVKLFETYETRRIQNNDGLTPGHLALLLQKEELASLLLSDREMSIADTNGNTPLQTAVRLKASPECITYVASISNPQKVNRGGMSPLAFAREQVNTACSPEGSLKECNYAKEVQDILEKRHRELLALKQLALQAINNEEKRIEQLQEEKECKHEASLTELEDYSKASEAELNGMLAELHEEVERRQSAIMQTIEAQKAEATRKQASLKKQVDAYDNQIAATKAQLEKLRKSYVEYYDND